MWWTFPSEMLWMGSNKTLMANESNAAFKGVTLNSGHTRKVFCNEIKNDIFHFSPCRIGGGGGLCLGQTVQLLSALS